MSGVQVWLELDGDVVRAGTLHAHRRGRSQSMTFTYESDFVGTAGSYSIDPGLPLALGPQHSGLGQDIFGAFSDCAPDRWGRTLIERREQALAREHGDASRQLGEVDYLLGVRDDLRQGALRFCREGPFLAEAELGVPALTDLPSLLDLAARAEADTADLEDLQRLVRVGSSLGGARPKAHVMDTDGHVAIAKFPSAQHDTWNVMAWESVALRLAGAVGIVVPRSTLLRLAGRSVLVLDRFDRDDAGRRIGYVSAMTMLEARDGDRRSYLDIAEVIEERSDRVTHEVRELWQRMVFSVLVSNTDDHLRNHGFLHHGGGVWRLCPAFDINPNPAPGPRYLSTALDASDDRADLAVALSVAALFRWGADEAEREVCRMANIVSTWRAVATSAGLSPREIEAMAPAFVAIVD